MCLLVVLEHSSVCLWNGSEAGTGLDGWLRWLILWPLKWNAGAPLFFVVSGYCIASSLDGLRRRNGSTLSFVHKRIRRIFPPYWASLAVTILLILGLDALGLSRLHNNPYSFELKAPGTLTAGQWIGNLTLTEIWRPLIGGGEIHVLTRVAWSLCYQEQFYLICALALCLGRGSLEKTLLWLTAGIVGLRVILGDVGWLASIEGLFPMLWHDFAVGLAIYWRLNLCRSTRGRWMHDIGLALVLAVVLYNGVVSTIAASAFGLLLVGLRRFDVPMARSAWATPLKYLGVRSYAMYLIHLPAAVLVSGLAAEFGESGFWTRAALLFPLATAGSIVAGIAFHAWVDKPWAGLMKSSEARPTLVEAPAIRTEAVPA